jgi:hypothetical protein
VAGVTHTSPASFLPIDPNTLFAMTETERPVNILIVNPEHDEILDRTSIRMPR